MACSSGCPTQDHVTYGECLRAKNVRHHALGGTGHSRRKTKDFERANEKYRQAVRDGLQPARVSEPAVNAAYEAAAGG